MLQVYANVYVGGKVLAINIRALMYQPHVFHTLCTCSIPVDLEYVASILRVTWVINYTCDHVRMWMYLNRLKYLYYLESH